MYGNLYLSFSPLLPTSRFPFLPVLPSCPSLPPVLSFSRAFLYTPNAYTFCQGLDKLTKLKLLSVQSNRLVKIEGLEALVKLEELYISHNGIKRLEGLDTLVNLVTLDVANNFIKRVENVSHLTKLEEFWVSRVMLIYSAHFHYRTLALCKLYTLPICMLLMAGSYNWVVALRMLVMTRP